MQFSHFIFCCTLFLLSAAPPPPSGIWGTDKGSIHFQSKAPLEVIRADSRHLRGLVNTNNQTFAFSVKMNTLEGFNSPLQQEHFNENYMESTRFPEATFSGKIIETIDFSKSGNLAVRAKGKLNIHGIEQERIIKVSLNIQADKISFSSDFSVPLSDHNIRIPKIVHQKIAEEVAVHVEGQLLPR
jgi:hypothetical protein